MSFGGGETQPDVGCIVECDWCRCTQDSLRFSLLMYTRVIAGAGAKRSVLWDVPVYDVAPKGEHFRTENASILIMFLRKCPVFPT